MDSTGGPTFSMPYVAPAASRLATSGGHGRHQDPDRLVDVHRVAVGNTAREPDKRSHGRKLLPITTHSAECIGKHVQRLISGVVNVKERYELWWMQELNRCHRAYYLATDARDEGERAEKSNALGVAISKHVVTGCICV